VFDVDAVVTRSTAGTDGIGDNTVTKVDVLDFHEKEILIKWVSSSLL
jgi:hypothetical protein